MKLDNNLNFKTIKLLEVETARSYKKSKDISRINETYTPKEKTKFEQYSELEVLLHFLTL